MTYGPFQDTATTNNPMNQLEVETGAYEKMYNRSQEGEERSWRQAREINGEATSACIVVKTAFSRSQRNF